MVEDVGRHILFSGCAHSRSGAPTRRAATALAKALHLDMWEAPETGCCGARADRKVSDEARQKALGPVYDGARQGLDVACLSPACGRVVGGFIAAMRDDAAHASGGSGAIRSIEVRDIAGLLDSYGLAQLAVAATANPLGGLRVAIHASCHGDHNAFVRPEHDEPEADAGRGGLGARLAGVLPRRRGSQEMVARTDQAATHQATQELAAVVQAVGPSIAGDVSAEGHCPEHDLVLNVKDRVLGAPASAPCLSVAARNGVDVVVTPCFLCYIGLNAYQKGLKGDNPAKAVPVLYLAQLVGLACDVAPQELGLMGLVTPARRILTPYLV